ncbi:hypothetical protein [Paenibacillus sp. A3M_27_13]|uniref:hypothetical protein n=1 Tax=Paenibacillus sp. A3M_27_13 TaxID=2962029 RepID=UPI0020B8C460|nr:hypothetical protein [Paenibacillus sp. A3M_27_13]MCP3747551.1 hypothetical protein [Paenibacillus sp. A3M_27_13]
MKFNTYLKLWEEQNRLMRLFDKAQLPSLPVESFNSITRLVERNNFQRMIPQFGEMLNTFNHGGLFKEWEAISKISTQMQSLNITNYSYIDNLTIDYMDDFVDAIEEALPDIVEEEQREEIKELTSNYRFFDWNEITLSKTIPWIMTLLAVFLTYYLNHHNSNSEPAPDKYEELEQRVQQLESNDRLRQSIENLTTDLQKYNSNGEEKIQ